MSTIKNVAVAGASGSLGTVVLDKLIASGKFNLTVLTRATSGYTAPDGATLQAVDYSSVESLKAALSGQDAVVSTLGSLALASQNDLIDAAVAAGVKRFIPSEFGSNLANPKNQRLPVYTHKMSGQEKLVEQAKSNDMTYTFVYNNAFLDWGLEQGFLLDLNSKEPTLLDGGEYPFSATTLSTVGDAVVGVLLHPEETRNRAVYIRDIANLTQNRLLELARQAAPEKTWEPKSVSLDDLVAKSDARLGEGIVDKETLVPYLWKAVFHPEHGGNFQETDNELLGLKAKTEDDVVEVIKEVLSK